eukprot:TRINITY_DN2501_c0_g1_i1.p1 TRINITY_DN2501_c0_g1~~TRINITY_DN2501_c0_g1_i1.p1  ORF type:complete len:459 (-),score=46.93 TRINITY_DN2501_c0_g1_i1:23-1399(-)
MYCGFIFFGTGILGLPVKLSHSGFGPFILTYGLGLLFQGSVLYCTIEVLLHARERRMEEKNNEINLEDFSLDAKSADEVEKHEEFDIDLHTVSVDYFPAILTFIFDFFLVLHFFTILTSYSLAGAAAYNILLNTNLQVVIITFTVGLTLVIIFLMKYIQYFISIMTFVKGSLLILVVLVTMIISDASDNSYVDNWAYIGQPFLIGTVALGGGYAILPFTFKKIHNRKVDLLLYVLAVGLALLFIFTLNVFWCFFLLQAIPQVGDSNITLEKSAEHGEIATIPLINTVRQNFPEYEWIAICIDLFIIVSITVSFLTVGTAFKHVLDGVAQSISYPANKVPVSTCDTIGYHVSNVHSYVKQGILYVVSYGLILLIALLNPEGFLVIVEKGSSIAMNGSALMIILMLNAARKQNFKPVLMLPDNFFNLIFWVDTIYFGFTIIYDIIVITMEFIPSINVEYL